MSPHELSHFVTVVSPQELSHFDPPTPPPDEDPHRFANPNRRGKRVAHKPTSATKIAAKARADKEEKKTKVCENTRNRLSVYKGRKDYLNS